MVTSGMAAVPSTIDDVTPQWLSAVLDGATVTDVRAERIAEDTGFSALLYRLHLVGEGVPSSVIVKLPAESEARGAMELLDGYQRELSFYRHVAGVAPLQTPRVYAARMIDGSADFVLVLEDLCDWDNADHLAGLSLDRARLCIEQLAGLHAWSSDIRNAAVLKAFPSIDTRIVRDLLIPAFG
ncbi:MAG TPA: aminoglycoside phosphotransferase, partial [Mycobacterium sp.]